MSDPHEREHGSLVLEAVLVVPALVVLVLGVAATLAPVADALVLDAAARAAARAVSLEGDPRHAEQVAAATVDGAGVEVELADGLVVVVLSRTRSVLGREVTTTGRAVVPLEPVVDRPRSQP